MFYHNINPVLLKLGHFEIRYYGLIFAIGFAIAYFLIYYLAKRKNLGLRKDDVADFLVYNVVGVIAGARLAYVIFYNFSFYLQNPLQMFAVWQGGLSFHGGLAGAILASYYFCKKKNVSFYAMADIVVVPVAIALALGRIGNFINGELFGRITQSSICVNYEQSQFLANPPKLCRYPSQLFESFKNILIFGVLWTIKDKKLPDGFLFWTFVMLYGLLRTIVELFRQPDEQVGFVLNYFTMGQLLSFPLFVLGLVMVIRLYLSKRRRFIEKIFNNIIL